MSIKKIFSSKPAQITHAAIKLTNQIFGEDKEIEVAAIGDKDLVFSIADNFRKFGYDNCKLFKSSNSLYIDSEKKKIIDKKKVLSDFFIFDVILIGFNDGLKVISKDITQTFLKKRKQKPIFYCAARSRRLSWSAPKSTRTYCAPFSRCRLSQTSSRC